MAGGIDANLALALAAVGGYVLGSIPFGLVFTRLAGLGDIRQMGSGNIGATNVLRTGHKGLALATLVCDSGKGAAAALAAAYLWGPEAGMAAGFAAVFGHNFPVWLGFKGGKGVATTLGVLLAVDFMVGLAVSATWLLVAGAFRYSSLAALGALAAAPFYAYWINGQSMTWMAGGLAVLAFIRHKDNIRRLIAREESKIGQKSKPAEKDDDA
ncbi:MAG TPA: acyl-phosphate glycerol 3-phosphate acyltransferase [Rhodospirillaceae bacterium]|nr:acyl-phosphate glycerol 3-phosphate acyltransferase [Rhodospirillaceae bacterium]